MQLNSIVLYHRDGERRHELLFRPGQLNVVTGVNHRLNDRAVRQ